MRYDDNSIVKVDQELLKPVDRLKVEMVRRLVEQQNVRIAEQCARKKYLDLLISV